MSEELDTTLHVAVRSKDIDEVQRLLRSGAEVNAHDETMETPLHIAVKQKNETITRLLLENGADIFVKGRAEFTPLHYAAQSENENVLRFILKYSAEKHFEEKKEFNVDVPNIFGGTPLFSAALLTNTNCIKLFLEYNADANYMSAKQFTPFQLAVLVGNIDGVVTFLDWGVDINMIYNKTLEYPYYFDFPCKENIKILIKNHIIKLKVAGFPLNKHLQAFSVIYEAFTFLKECEEEVERMKQKISDTTVSYHDILLNRSDKSAYGSNKNITLNFESNCYKMDFPIYASMIERQYRKGIQRQMLMEEGRHSLESLFNRLPYVCLRKILSFLSNDELKRLIDTC